MRSWAAALTVAAALTGCGGSTGRVSGVVTLDGQPLEGATVSFSPASGAGDVGGSSGKTDAQGRYTLRTVIGDKPGAAVGKHKVTISLYKANPTNPDQAGQELVPPRYSDPARSELTFDVPSGGTDTADFKLETPKGKGAK